MNNHTGHIIDSVFFGDNYSTPESRKIFSDERRVQRWLQVEAALAGAQGELGIIPRAAAAEIKRRCAGAALNPARIAQKIHLLGHSLVPILKELEKTCRNKAGEYIHYGATTQDIQDTAQALEMRDILDIVSRDTAVLMRLIVKLAVRHRKTLITGRTHGQAALPTTFGLKTASWLDELHRSAERVRRLRGESLCAQLFGGVGTQSAIGPDPKKLLGLFSKKLGLAAPETAWHSSRDRIASFGSALAILAGCLGRIGNEICALRSSEVGELGEFSLAEKVGSSTMPHKRNPNRAEQLVVLARLTAASLPPLMEGLIHQHERDGRALRLEWAALPTLCMNTAGALALAKAVVGTMQVLESRMAENAVKLAHLLCSEAVMFELGRKVGKQTAHSILHEIYGEGNQDREEFVNRALANPEFRKHFGKTELLRMLDPYAQTGTAAAQTDAVVKAVRGGRGARGGV